MDDKRFRLFMVSVIFLITIIISYNVLAEYMASGPFQYFKRKVYYEKVISKKGLSLHRARYWRPID
jgi:hypothetical protein